jgi:hypothetical protein
MKADIKLCASSFSVVTLPVYYLLGQGLLVSCIVEDKTYHKRLCFSDELFHMCVKQSTGTTVTYKEVKILMMLLNMSVIQ